MIERLRPIVLFDRDGTLNVDKGYTHRPEDLVWLPGAREAVRLVNGLGFLVVVVTNQAGIARGYYDEAAMHRFHEQMAADLTEIGAHIDAFYFCPYHADAAVHRYRHPNHPERKPNPGMILRAFAENQGDPCRALIVGDQASDLEAGRAANIATLHASGASLFLLLRSALEELEWTQP